MDFIFRNKSTVTNLLISILMANKKEETASFVLRFTQKVFQSEAGEPEVQWRGNIRHVQGGQEKRFSEFDDALEFIREKLADLTILAMEDKTPEEQKGILAKSFDMWKKMALTAPQLVLDTIKDPKKQMEQMQTQFQSASENISQKIEETIAQKVPIDEWRASSKSDYKNLVNLIEKLATDVDQLNKKVDKMGKKK